jgi:hypothetical protein
VGGGVYGCGLPIQLDVQEQKGKEQEEEYGFQVSIEPTTNIVASWDVPPNKEGDAIVAILEHTYKCFELQLQMLQCSFDI